MANILVLEDDLALSFRMRKLLEEEGHEIRSFTSAQRALEAYDTEDVDLVISDIYIHADGKVTTDGGILLIGSLRTKEVRNGRNTPVLAISGAGMKTGNPFVLSMARSVGAEKTLEKPFDDQEFLSAVSELLAA